MAEKFTPLMFEEMEKTLWGLTDCDIDSQVVEMAMASPMIANVIMAYNSSGKRFTYREIIDAVQEMLSGKQEPASPRVDLAPPSTKIEWPNTNLSYEEAVALSQKNQKPLLLFFTGYACVNAQKMGEYILSDAQIQNILNNEVVFVALFTDEMIKSEKGTTTIGEQNLKLQISKFGNNLQPLFVILNLDEEIISMRGYTSDKNAFLDFLHAIH